MGVQFFRMPLIFFDFPHHTKQEKKSELIFTLGDALNLRL
jgi:CRISPR/Cas system-associated protein endoribonuclease Cas2